MKLDTTNTHPDMDYEQHIGTYKNFTRGTIIAIIVLAVLLIGMAIGLT